jgi:hypothetical protein
MKTRTETVASRRLDQPGGIPAGRPAAGRRASRLVLPVAVLLAAALAVSTLGGHKSPEDPPTASHNVPTA